MIQYSNKETPSCLIPFTLAKNKLCKGHYIKGIISLFQPWRVPKDLWIVNFEHLFICLCKVLKKNYYHQTQDEDIITVSIHTEVH